MLKAILRLLAFTFVLVPPMIFFPVVCLLPPLLALRHPGEDWSGVAQLLFWFGTFSAAFWTLLLSQWTSAMRWQRMGRLHQWRCDHGGIIVTVSKATCWMFLGLVGSFIAELAFMFAFLLRMRDHF